MALTECLYSIIRVKLTFLWSTFRIVQIALFISAFRIISKELLKSSRFSILANYLYCFFIQIWFSTSV